MYQNRKESKVDKQDPSQYNLQGCVAVVWWLWDWCEITNSELLTHLTELDSTLISLLRRDLTQQ